MEGTMTMTEDFVGAGGKLEEEFVYAPNNSLKTEKFVAFEVRAVLEKPALMAGLRTLKAQMGEFDFNKYVNSIENINISGSSMLILTGDEKVRTILVSRWLEQIKAAFKVDNVRVVGGGKGGVDAY